MAHLYSLDAANMNPHGCSGDFKGLSRYQRGPQLGSLANIGLEMHMNTVNQLQRCVGKFVMEANFHEVRGFNPICARCVLYAEGEI
jgi:hypothetical protein